MESRRILRRQWLPHEVAAVARARAGLRAKTIKTIKTTA